MPDKDYRAQTGDTALPVERRLREWLEKFPRHLPLVLSWAGPGEPALPLELLDLAGERVPRLVTGGPAGENQPLEPVLRLDLGLDPGLDPDGAGLLKVWNRVAAWSAPRDIVAVTAGTDLPPGWLDRLRAAAYCRSNVACATALNRLEAPLARAAGTQTLAEVDRKVQAASLQLRPVLAAPGGGCSWYRRAALDIAGEWDESLPPEQARLDFAQRAALAGFTCVLADDLVVSSPPETRAGPSPELAERYPWLGPGREDSPAAAGVKLARAWARAAGALQGYRVAIDATCLNGYTTGAQVLVLELIRELAARPVPGRGLAVLVRGDLPEQLFEPVRRLVDNVIPVTALEEVTEPLFDLIHRPYQLYAPGELHLLQKAARRFIVSQLDFIGYAIPSYFPTPEDWRYFQALTGLALASADGIAFISRDAAGDAGHRGFDLPPERSRVIYLGVDHQLHQAALPVPPLSGGELPRRGFIVMLGHNYRHKNRVYALKLFQELAKKYGWRGKLAFAGPDVAFGGSGEEETRFKISHPELAARLYYLGAVSEAEKEWLLENAALVLYPSTYEGFGLVPFEAAAAGTPALTTRLTSLNEVLGDEVTYLELLDPGLDAAAAWGLITDPALAALQVERLRVRARAFKWSEAARQTWQFYEEILALPPRAQKAELGEKLQAQKAARQHLAALEQGYRELENWSGEINRRLSRLERKPLYRLLSKLRLL